MVDHQAAVLVFFIVVGAHGVQRRPLLATSRPNGFGGIETAAALIFFAYIGFDAVSHGQ